MNILIINTYHYNRGGDSKHALELGELLKYSGHEVHYFSMHSCHNHSCTDSNFFVSEINFRDCIKTINPVTSLNVLTRTIYSRESKQKLIALLKHIQPDIAHLHSIRHHITKSILPVLAKMGIPIIWSLHDFKEICPNTSFFDGHTVCEQCKHKKYMYIVWKRCKKRSYMASIITLLEVLVNNRKKYDKLIDLYISPSKFLRQKFIEYGYQSQRIVHLPNFLDTSYFQPHYSFNDYFLYVGRLEKEKGIETLIRGFARKKKSSCSSKLIIVGTGTLQPELEKLVQDLGMNDIVFTGYLQGSKLRFMMQNAKSIIIPSEWYENYPFAALEAMAYGKLVIGSKIGGIPEQVEDGITGFLYEPCNDVDLAEKMIIVDNLSEDEINRMGRNARLKVEKINNPQIYLSNLMDIYNRLLHNKDLH